MINLFDGGTLSKTAARLSSPPSCPPEQPQGLSAPSSLPVMKTTSTSGLQPDFTDVVDIANIHETLIVSAQIQVTNRVIGCFAFISLPAALLFLRIESAAGDFEFFAAFYIHIEDIGKNL